MSKKLAVAVIHGIGNQGEKRPPISSEATFSKGLRNKVRRQIGGKFFDETVAWREIFWADILLPRQMRYLEAIRDKVNYERIRGFVLCHLADVAAYRNVPDAENHAYELMQERVRETLAELNEDTGDTTPLLILAHSFGGHIMSDYIWDVTHQERGLPTPFQRLETVGGFHYFRQQYSIVSVCL